MIDTRIKNDEKVEGMLDWKFFDLND